MGFGTLFIGYFITYVMALNSFGVAFRLLGYIVMSVACSRLAAYNKSFRYPAYASMMLVGLSTLGTLSEIFRYLYDNLVISGNIFGGVVGDIISYADTAAVFIFHVLLLIAIVNIAKEIGISKIESSAIRNIFFIGIYFLLQIIGKLPLPIKESYNRNMGLPIFILYLAWILLDLMLIFSCYYGICDENDTDMKRKPSRFEFVNRYRAELEEKQERRKAQDEKYRKELMEKRKNKKR